MIKNLALSIGDADEPVAAFRGVTGIDVRADG
jgi:hypothetical protein